MVFRPRLAWLLAAVLTSGCAEPPHKEMDQAQGAIDAARAAGADRFAATELAAATAALESANTAVSQRDYRLALNHALASRERAQNAAREASEARARRRGDLERTMAELTALLLQARTRYGDASRARPSPPALKAAGDGIAAADRSLQEAGKALSAEEYDKAEASLAATRERLTKAEEAIEAASPQIPRRRG